jgi:hypothetical protein
MVVLPDMATLAVLSIVLPMAILIPDTMKVLVLKDPAITVSVSNTSNMGKPDMSFTENKEPVSTSVTLNNLPCVPSTENLSKAVVAVV